MTRTINISAKPSQPCTFANRTSQSHKAKIAKEPPSQRTTTDQNERTNNIETKNTNKRFALSSRNFYG